LARRLIAGLRRRLPRRTLQLRLAAFYGGLFLISGVILLAIPNILVRAATASVEAAPGSALPIRRAVLLQQHGADIHAQLVFSLLALVFMVGASFGLGWVVAGRVLRPLRFITATAREISASNLHRRLALQGPDDEFRELGATLDDLFSRLESSFDSQRRFVANASHELRTPLTAERALLQVALADPAASADSLRAACEQVLKLGGQQEQLIAALLTLATSERGVERWEPVDLSAIAEQAALSRQDEAARRRITVTLDCSPARCSGDPRLVEIMVSNLMDNAIRHNVEGGWAKVITSTGPAGVALNVANSGPVVRPEEVDRLFQPFQRQTGARVHRPDGHGLGLGLAIVRAIARDHHAQLDARARPDGGLVIDVMFPSPAETGPTASPRLLPR
jgi:signal transduction histidine kinase